MEKTISVNPRKGLANLSINFEKIYIYIISHAHGNVEEENRVLVKVKVKQSRYRPGGAQRVPRS